MAEGLLSAWAEALPSQNRGISQAYLAEMIPLFFLFRIVIRQLCGSISRI
jgi:hypothetical protein